MISGSALSRPAARTNSSAARRWRRSLRIVHRRDGSRESRGLRPSAHRAGTRERRRTRSRRFFADRGCLGSPGQWFRRDHGPGIRVEKASLRIFSPILPHPAASRLESRRPPADRMRVGRHEMDEPPPKKLLTRLERPVAEVAEETSGRDLNHRPAGNDPREKCRVVSESPIALGMGDDRRDVEQRKLVEDRIRRRRQCARQELQEQVAPAIQRRERTRRAALEELDGVRGKRDTRSRREPPGSHRAACSASG